jgi:hypothetical protein
MSCSTWARPFGKDLVSGVAISLASCRISAGSFTAFPRILPSSGKAF